jgi:hypothetical protein
VTEAVNHPAHYGGADDPYEHIKVADAWGLNYRLGNSTKYIARAGKKGGPEKKLEDLRKARWYLDDEIRQLENVAASHVEWRHDPYDPAVKWGPTEFTTSELRQNGVETVRVTIVAGDVSETMRSTLLREGYTVNKVVLYLPTADGQDIDHGQSHKEDFVFCRPGQPAFPIPEQRYQTAGLAWIAARNHWINHAGTPEDGGHHARGCLTCGNTVPRNANNPSFCSYPCAASHQPTAAEAVEDRGEPSEAPAAATVPPAFLAAALEAARPRIVKMIRRAIRDGSLRG